MVQIITGWSWMVQGALGDAERSKKGGDKGVKEKVSIDG